MPTSGIDILGSLELVTAPSGSVVSLEGGDGMKAFLRVHGNEDDDLITALMISACDYIEREIDGNRTLRQTTFNLPVSEWWDEPLNLPRPALSSVTSITYLDTNNATQTVSTSDYTVKTPWRQPGTVELIWTSEPSLYAYSTWPITIRFVAGYASGSVPTVLQTAIKLLTRAWYDEVAVDEKLTACIRNLCAAEGWGSYA